jgi:hypothetical protein
MMATVIMAINLNPPLLKGWGLRKGGKDGTEKAHTGGYPDNEEWGKEDQHAHGL